MEYQNISTGNVVICGKLLKPGESDTLEKAPAIEILVKNGILKQSKKPK